jgi:ubiquitin thioesterase OTU1
VIAEEVKIKAFRVKLKCGYPPKALDDENDKTLSSLGIKTGEMFIVEEDMEAVAPVDKLVNEITTSSQTPDSDGMIMLRRIIAADNSCLFNSVGFAMEHSKTNASELRSLIQGFVMSDSETYNETFLDRTPDSYV